MAAKKRTRQEKARAQAKRQQMLAADTAGVQTAPIQQAVGYSFKASDLGIKQSSKTQNPTTKTKAETQAARRDYVHELFAYDVRLIYRDLLKTIALTLTIFIILGGIAWYLR